MEVSDKTQKMSRQEAGRRGGEKVARERGTEFYRRIGKKGGEKVAEERGSEFYREIGRRGGASRGSRKSAVETKGAPGRSEPAPRNKRQTVRA
jgi:general stress protein YciG